MDKIVSLKNSFLVNGHRAAISAWAIVAGLALDIVVLLLFSTDKSWIETGCAIFATFVIAAGVGFEIHFDHKAGAAAAELQRISDETIAEANARAAEANQKASEAQLETARLRKQIGPREIDEEVFLRELDSKPTAPIEIWFLREDGEAFMLARQVVGTLHRSQWKQIGSPQPITPSMLSRFVNLPSAMAMGASPVGITVVMWGIKDGKPISTATATDISSALSKSLMGGVSTVILISGILEAPDEGTVRVIIGPKP